MNFFELIFFFWEMLWLLYIFVIKVIIVSGFLSNKYKNVYSYNVVLMFIYIKLK